MSEKRTDIETIESYYASLKRDDAVVSRCKMWLPTGSSGKDLWGQTIVDIACRKGKGVYEIAEDVGPNGRAIGIDWDLRFLETAQHGIPHAMSKMPWMHAAPGAERLHSAGAHSEREAHASQGAMGADQKNENLITFVHGYPERLLDAGLQKYSVDMVFVNTAAAMFYDPRTVYAQIAQILRPGGRLYHEMVCAQDEMAEGGSTEDGTASDGIFLSDATRQIFARKASSLLHVPTKDGLFSMLHAAGFQDVHVVAETPVDVPRELHAIRHDISSAYTDVVVEARVCSQQM